MNSKHLNPVVVLPAMVVWVLAAGPAFADVNDLGWYAGFRAVPTLAQVEDETIIGGPGGVFRLRDGDLGSDRQAVIGAAAMVGYHWSKHGLPVRTELEYTHRFQLDFDTVASGPPKVGYKTDVTSDTVMLNLYLDISTDYWWRPYLGVGLGWSRNHADSQRGDSSSLARPKSNNAVNNFAFSAAAGLRFAITSDWVGEIGYRYIDLGEIDTGAFSTGDRITADNYTSHDLVLGLVYAF